MASSRLFFAFILSISSQIPLGFSRNLDAFLQAADSAVHPPGQIPPCMQKIIPCQPYIKSPVNPSPMCCLPLKEMLVDDRECLCSFFNNAALLQALNVTQSEALKLPAACGADVDVSECNHARAISPASSPTPIGSTDAPISPAKTLSGSSPSKTSSASRKYPTYGIGYGLAAASSFVALHILGSLLSF